MSARAHAEDANGPQDLTRGVSPQSACHVFRRRAATIPRSGCGEADDECGEGVAPDPRLLTGCHQSAEFYRGESFAECMKLAGGVSYRTRAKQARGFESCNPCLEPGEGIRCCGAELAGQVGRGQRVLHSDPKQGWMFDRETAEDRDSGFDEVGGWVVCSRQLIDRCAEHLKRTSPEGDKQTVLGTEQAVNGAGGRPDVVSQPPDRETFETGRENDPLGCIEQRARGSFVVLSRASHRCYVTRYVTVYRKGGAR